MRNIAIIGGGIAGLSAGIYAQKANFNTVIYEKNPVAGGLCSSWYRKSCLIDNCIHWLIGSKKETSLYKLWNDLGVLDDTLEIIHPEILYTSELNGRKITLWQDIEKTKREMLALSPLDKEEISKLIEQVKKSNSIQIPIDMPIDMMEPQELIAMFKSMWGTDKDDADYSRINVRDLSRRFKHPLLRALIRDFLSDEYAAMFFINTYSSFAAKDGGIPKGGSREIVRRLEEKYKTLGGTLKVNCGVNNVELRDNSNAIGIHLSNGEFIPSDYVICACDTYHVFSQLLDKSYMDHKMRRAYKMPDKYPVSSGFHTALTVEGEFKEVPHTLAFECRPIQIANTIYDRMSVTSYGYDQDFAPGGKTVIQIVFPQYNEDYLYWVNLYRDVIKYKEKKEMLAAALAERLIERFPQYKGKFEIIDTWTPVTYSRICNCYNGSYNSYIMANNDNSMFFSGKIKNLNNVFLASQWLMVPGGIPTAAAMGKFAVQWILKAENRSIHI